MASVRQTSVLVQQRWHVAIPVTILTLKMKKLMHKSDISEVMGLLVGRLQLDCTPSSEPRILSRSCSVSLVLVILWVALREHPAHVPGCAPSMTATLAMISTARNYSRWPSPPEVCCCDWCSVFRHHCLFLGPSEILRIRVNVFAGKHSSIL